MGGLKMSRKEPEEDSFDLHRLKIPLGNILTSFVFYRDIGWIWNLKSLSGHGTRAGLELAMNWLGAGYELT